jgi:hypothetical protein
MSESRNCKCHLPNEIGIKHWMKNEGLKMKSAKDVNLKTLAQNAESLFKWAIHIRALEKMLAKELPAFKKLEAKVQSHLRRKEAPDQFDEWLLSTRRHEIGMIYETRSAAMREIAWLQHQIGKSANERLVKERVEELEADAFFDDV